MTFEKAFESIKKKFVNSDASGMGDFAVQITFSDEDCGGTFYAEVKNGVLHVEPYDYHDNNAALTISKTALLGYLGKRMSLEKAISDAGSSVFGDASKVEDLRKLVSVEKRAYTSKKAAAEKKETDAKKAAAPAKKTAAKKASARSKTATKTSKKAAASK